MLILTGLLLAGCPGTRQSPVLPEDLPQRYSLRDRERPSDYRLIEVPELKERLGVETNPGYIVEPSEHKAIAGWGGIISFVAAYGSDEDVRLLLNGIYFKGEDKFERFWRDQEKKRLRMAGFAMEANAGYWVLLIALDPNDDYENDEIEALREGLGRYQKRLGLESLFDQLHAESDG